MEQLSARRGDVLIAASAIGFGMGTALVVGTFAAGTGRLHRNGALRALAQGAINPGRASVLSWETSGSPGRRCP